MDTLRVYVCLSNSLIASLVSPSTATVTFRTLAPLWKYIEFIFALFIVAVVAIFAPSFAI